MKCYYHHDRDAFGINIVTGKALCLECLEEYKGMIIEKNDEFSKKAVENLLVAYKQIRINWNFIKVLVPLLIVAGCLLILIGLLSPSTSKTSYLLLFSGIFALLFGLSLKKYTKK